MSLEPSPTGNKAVFYCAYRQSEGRSDDLCFESNVLAEELCSKDQKINAGKMLSEELGLRTAAGR